MTDIEAPRAGHSPDDVGSRQARRQQALEAIFGGKFRHSFLSPYMVIEDHVIECPVAIRFYKKDFNYLSKQLYLEYQYRSWNGFNPELLDKYATITTTKLAAIDTLMQNNINRLLKLLEQHGHLGSLTLWPGVLRTDVPIIAAQARAYIGVLSKMDRLYTLSGTANLLGVIDSSQRADVEFTAKKAVRAFRSILQTEVTRLYREAQRIIAEQHKTGKVDAAMASVLQQQSQDIAEFAASTQHEGEELTLDLMRGEPGQLIAEAAAASVAAAAAGGTAAKNGRSTKTKAQAALGEAAEAVASAGVADLAAPAAAL
ncbi:hypothetical protein [Ramlibacter sp. AN1133]|uniref:hypothetical protein n=1 Tax=Ramlibacter sp. AN1133 TaxID=3133429 RepID=UPI0030BDE475